MGRMLETLNQAGMKPIRVMEEPPPAADVQPCPDLVVEAEDEIPFIEVGGRGTPIEASAAVLASGPACSSQVVLTPPGPKAPPDQHEPVLVIPPEPAAVKLAFRPLVVEPVLEPDPGRFAPELVAFHEPHGADSIQYCDLLAGVEAQLPVSRPQVLLFTAASQGAGTTTTLLNLAITAAQRAGPRVVVVDANLRRPALAERLGLQVAPGLGEILAGTATVTQVLQETEQTNLLALTIGRPSPGGGLRLIGEAWRTLLYQLRERFERIFVDATPWDGRPELVALGAACDVIYLVLRPTEEETPEVADLLRVIPLQGGRLRGCIVTRQ